MFASSFLVLFCLVVSGVQAITVSAPVQLNRQTFSDLFARSEDNIIKSLAGTLKSRGLHKRTQTLLNSDDGLSQTKQHKVEIWPFRLLIDLAWDILFVPSADCRGDCGEFNPKFKFYSNRSSTYSLLNSYASTSYGTDRFTGELAHDTFYIAGLDINHQEFINADRAEPMGFVSFYYEYDGVLGLAPRFYELGKDNLRMPRLPWVNVINGTLLDANLFALELPTGNLDLQGSSRVGEISFGSISRRYESSDFVQLPLSEFSDQAWIVEVPSLTWENLTHPLHEDFVNVTLAAFDTTAWYIGLPGDWTARVYQYIGQKCGSIFCTVDCHARETMPNLTFGLAGEKITITAYDYVMEFANPHGGSVCTFNLYPTKGQFPTDAIILGSPFLEAFYTVFDLDELEVRLTKRVGRD